MAHGGPWLGMAVLCEEAGIDSAGRRFIRGLMDKAELVSQGVEPPPGTAYEVDSQLLLALQLRAGDARSPIQLRIDVEGEDGMAHPGAVRNVEFVGQGIGRGVWENLTLNVGFWRSGAYWINVVVNGRLLTRVPFTVSIHWTGVHHA